MSELNPGDRVRFRWAEDWNDEEGVVSSYQMFTREYGEFIVVLELSMPYGSEFLHVEETSLVFSLPCNVSAQDTEDDAGVDTAEMRWPTCVRVNVGSPSVQGAGLFVNLGAFNITEGCFQGDCSHSDHFACSSAADCARICSEIGACVWWTFWRSPAACWLRRIEQGFEVHGALSGTASCAPPPLGDVVADPTLFGLVLGGAGILSPALWDQMHLPAILERFGHMTVSEIKHTEPSAMRWAALHVVAVASSRCAESWHGCWP